MNNRTYPTIYSILDNMTALEHLSITNNFFYEIRDTERFAVYPYPPMLWQNIKLIDLSSNQFSYFSLEFCTYVEMRKDLIINITNNYVHAANWKRPTIHARTVTEKRNFPTKLFVQFAKINVSSFFFLFSYKYIFSILFLLT